MKKTLTITTILALAACTVTAQEKKGSPLKITGYAEIYYGFDLNRPANNNRPGFVYSHNRHNEVNLNLGFLKANYDDGKIRGNLAVMAGTYANANLAAEQGVLKNVFEANAGIKLSKTANLWLDAGIFASHIGFESAISKDCWVLTRNIASDNTPYYESGAKLTYITNDGKLTLSGLYLNGWQRINRQDGNSAPAGGVQVYYKATDKITLNYSNYLGTEGADSVRVRRFYHNFYSIFQLSSKLGFTAGLDYGTQQKAKGSNDVNHVISPVAIARYQVADQWALAGRFEYYEDRNGMIIASGTSNGFRTKGYSLNVDYAPVSNAVIRLEGKFYDSKDKIFVKQQGMTNTSPLVTASFAVSF
ncbi:porin [Mucilaginibacter myungsuensis]|uniref:Porin n=1 Tax=Mucilaginibacter myungsuensis TaxID=649104 RepID=A0A929PVK8_9SPHI|nr:porin [Mucilaginibacter myungsuensis]MBE9661234.1 porin [Mucilaginibacter myungsuensis]MDN3597378.1 porin [Mucilaginibacter myungsuensis]